MNIDKDFKPQGMKLDPEVVFARAEARKKRLSITAEELMQERKKEETDLLVSTLKKNKKEIIITYLGLLTIILGPILLYQLFIT